MRRGLPHTDGAPVRVAIAGFGLVAETAHVPAYGSRSRFQVVAVADPVPARREAASRLIPGITTVGSTEALLEVDFDMLDVCSPPVFHFGQIREGLRAGKDVLCEKPLVRDSAEFAEILRLADERRRLLYPCHNWEFAPPVMRARRLISEGAIGEPQRAVIRVDRTASSRGIDAWRPDWRQDRSTAGGGVWTDHGPHVVYLAEALLDQQVTAVSLRAEYAGHDVEQAVAGSLDLNGREAEVRLSWVADHRGTSYAVAGTAGELLITDRSLQLRGRRCLDEKLRAEDALDNGAQAAWYRHLLDELAELLDNRCLSTPALAAARRVVSAIEQGYVSAAAEGRVVRVDTECGSISGVYSQTDGGQRS